MNNVLHDVGIGPGGYGVEEIAGDDRASLNDPHRLQVGRRPGHDMRQVKQNAFHVRVALENAREHRAMSASDVGEKACLPEIISFQNRRDEHLRDVHHGRIEDGGLLGISLEEIEQRPSEGRSCRGLAGLYGVHQMRVGAEVKRIREKHDERAQGPRMIGT